MPLIDDVLPAPVLKKLRHLSRLARESRAASIDLARDLDHLRTEEAKHLQHIRSHHKQEFELNDAGEVHEVKPVWSTVRTNSGSHQKVTGKKLERRAELDAFFEPLHTVRRRLAQLCPEYDDITARSLGMSRALAGAKELLNERYPALRAPGMSVEF